MNEQMVMVPAGALAMIKNALKRDAEEGRQVRGEMVAELDARTITDPAAMAAELGKMMGQEPSAYRHTVPWQKYDGSKVKDIFLYDKPEPRASESIPLYRVPQPAPDYAVAIERAAEVCEEARAKEVKSARDYTDSFMPNLARDHTIRADELGQVVEAIRALVPAGVTCSELDREPYGLELVTAVWDAQAAGKRVYIVTVAP